MLEESAIQEKSGTPQPALIFSSSEIADIGLTHKPVKEITPKDEKASKQPAVAQAPLVFSESKSIPLGFSNKLLRKAAYGFGILSFLLTGLSGISNQNHWRTASGFGSAGINIASLMMKERDEPLPDASVPAQMGHAILNPTENTLFFNKSGTFVMDVLKFAAGVSSARRTELMEGAWKIGSKAVDIAGMSDQDRREKLALTSPDSKKLKKEVSPLHRIFANRWVALSNSAVAAGLQIAQGLEHNDKKMLTSGLFYFLAVSAQITDNAIMESKIKKTRVEKGRG